MTIKRSIAFFLCCFLLLSATNLFAEDSKLLATGGVTQVEGAAGSGIVPWAVIAGYAQEDEWGITAFDTYLSTDDFELSVYGVALGFDNRYEISFAKQTLNLGPLQANLGLPSNELRLRVIGAKVKLFGDFIYGTSPQISLGIQNKKIDDFTIPNLVGALDSSSTDVYLSASKLWLDGLNGVPIIANVTIRSTEANQIGFLGFGGDLGSGRQLLWEVNASLLLSRDLVLGYDYRQKPNNLSFATEEHWQDLFLAYFYDKSVSAVIAWADLGNIAGLTNQRGLYLSLQATF